MFTRSRDTADHRVRAGLTSYFLFGRGDSGESDLAVTWVDVEPGARQRLHHHPERQVYVIVRGGGVMQVGDETQQVKAGDLVYIPSNAMHGIENNTDELLSYVSAATPAFDLTKAYDRGQLTPEAYEKP